MSKATKFKVALLIAGFCVCLAGVAGAQAGEKWRLGMQAYSFNRFTFYEAVEKNKALGMSYIEPTVEVEVHEYDVLPDDIYLLCSDGLPDMVEDEDIHLTISTFNASLDIVGKQLIELANDHGGRDNVSVQLAQVITPFAARKGILAKLAGVFRT